MRDYPSRRDAAFTLIELLVVVAVIAVLIATLLPALASARQQGDRAISSINLKSLGVALELYLDDNNQDYPRTSHGNPDLSTAWVYTLAPYLDGAKLVQNPDNPEDTTDRIYQLGDIRVCPRDPNAEERLQNGGTSYITNEFVTVPDVGPFGDIKPESSFTNRRRLLHPSRVPVIFIGADDMGLNATNDHTHSRSWFTWASVNDDVATTRFGNDAGDGNAGSSLYLYADNHLEHTQAAELKALIDEGVNFADPARP